MNQRLIQKWALLLVLVPIFYSCQTYNSKINTYYGNLARGQFDAADRDLDHNKFLHRNRNRLLLYLEKGKTAFLRGAWEESNQYLNAADSLLEAGGSRAVDFAVGLLVNPAMQQYKGEAFERILIHYYKALNYLHLGKTEDAVVEARRITLRNWSIGDQHINKDKKYAADAFSLILQGIIYESARQPNDAFISYRNAAELFLKKEDTAYYGVNMPEQLQQDLLRTAWQNGFTTELHYYEQQFGKKYTPGTPPAGGELVLFWENGLAPVKAENNFFFTLTRNHLGAIGFTDEQHTLFIPFDFSNFSRDSADKLTSLSTFRIAFPKYVEQPLYFTHAFISSDSTSLVPVEKVEDVNQLAFKTLQERFIKEMSIALSRLAIKKLVQHEISKKDETAAQLFDIAALLVEKADTRNWQSLPYAIYYARIPLKKGPNEITLRLSNTQGATDTVRLSVTGKGALQTLHYATMQRL